MADSLYYMKQTVGNACGTVGILHAVGNATDKVTPAEGSYLDKFMQATRSMAPMEIAEYLEEEDEIEEQHTTAAAEGNTAPPPMEENVNTHFICLTAVEGSLYELDGRKKGPVNHGPSSPETLLRDACNVIKQFIERDPGEYRFTIVALAPTEG